MPHARAATADVYVVQRNSSGFNSNRVVAPAANSLLGFDASKLPIPVTIGSGLQLTSGVLSATGGGGGGGGTWGSITGTLGDQSDLAAALALKAPLASPTFTGVPAAPTAAADTNTTQLATTAFVIGQTYLKASTAASTYQPLSANLTSWAAITRASGFDTFAGAPSGANLASLLTTALPASKGGTGLTALSVNVVSLLGAADYAAMKALLDLEAGTDFLGYPTGTPTGSKFLRDDNSWQSISGGGDALVANPLSQFASTTSAQLAGVISNETGSGVLVFNSDPVLLAPNNALGALAIDVTKRSNTKSVSADSTFTFSATATAGAIFGLTLTNSDTAEHVMTIPSSYSLALGVARTTFTLPASSTFELSWRYDGSIHYLAGEPVSAEDLSTITVATGDLLALRDISADLDGKATVAAVVLAGLPAFTGDATSSAGASALTLATVNANVGTFGSATAVGAVTVNAKGLVTAASNVTVTPAVGSITGFGTGVATALAVNVGSAGAPVVNGGALGTPSSGTLTNATGLPQAGTVGLTTADSPQFAGVNVGHASDTTLTRTGAGDIAVEGNALFRVGGSFTGLPGHEIIAISDETTAITTGTAKVTWRAPFALTITAVRASLATASSSGTPTFDINEGGTTILSTKLTIDASEKTSTTAATAAVISDSAIADDAEITIDVDTAGTGAAGAKITIYYVRA